MPRISFIIPAHNEEALIGQTVANLFASAREALGPEDDRFEIIVVDDSSADRTGLIAAQHGARVVPIARRQIAAARNAGAAAAHGNIFIFVDADTLVPPEAICSAVRTIEQGAVAGGAMVRFDGRVPVWVRLALPLFLWIYRTARLAAGCYLFCTRRAFEAAGGFDETLFAGEEVVMSQSLKRHGRLIVIPETVTTSGRKLRTFAAIELLSITLRVLIRGKKAVQKREGLDLWYGPRRADPGQRAVEPPKP